MACKPNIGLRWGKKGKIKHITSEIIIQGRDVIQNSLGSRIVSKWNVARANGPEGFG
ncbi:hypothetical protein Defa_10950 [Desulfovibrio sp. TH_2024_36128]|uniref:Uncharacterized protein n=1 Tax=Desulfovibrio falkowii TaxID=3136602 RepID=A0ABQ0E7D1_9BACT